MLETKGKCKKYDSEANNLLVSALRLSVMYDKLYVPLCIHSWETATVPPPKLTFQHVKQDQKDTTNAPKPRVVEPLIENPISETRVTEARVQEFSTTEIMIPTTHSLRNPLQYPLKMRCYHVIPKYDKLPSTGMYAAPKIQT